MMEGAAGEGILQMSETFTALWQRHTDTGYVKPKIVNIFLNGYSLDGTQ